MKSDRHQAIQAGRVLRGNGEEYRVDIVALHGVPTLLLRLFATSNRGKPHPTQHSVAIDLKCLPMVRRCLDNAEKIAREINLLREAA